MLPIDLRVQNILYLLREREQTYHDNFQQMEDYPNIKQLMIFHLRDENDWSKIIADPERSPERNI